MTALILQIFYYLASYIIHTAVGNTKIHFLVAPYRTGYSQPVKGCIYSLEPFESVLRFGKVNYAVFAAV